MEQQPLMRFLFSHPTSSGVKHSWFFTSYYVCLFVDFELRWECVVALIERAGVWCNMMKSVLNAESGETSMIWTSCFCCCFDPVGTSDMFYQTKLLEDSWRFLFGGLPHYEHQALNRITKNIPRLKGTKTSLLFRTQWKNIKAGKIKTICYYSANFHEAGLKSF